MKLPGKVLIIVTPPAQMRPGGLAAIVIYGYPQEAGSAPNEQPYWHVIALIKSFAKETQLSR